MQTLCPHTSSCILWSVKMTHFGFHIITNRCQIMALILNDVCLSEFGDVLVCGKAKMRNVYVQHSTQPFVAERCSSLFRTFARRWFSFNLNFNSKRHQSLFFSRRLKRKSRPEIYSPSKFQSVLATIFGRNFICICSLFCSPFSQNLVASGFPLIW